MSEGDLMRAANTTTSRNGATPRSAVGGTGRSGRLAMPIWLVGIIVLTVLLTTCAEHGVQAASVPFQGGDAYVHAMRDWSISQDYWTLIDDESDEEVLEAGVEACALLDAGVTVDDVIETILGDRGEEASTEMEAVVTMASRYLCDRHDVEPEEVTTLVA